MAKSLVIVESPAKAKTIEKYLGKGYKVIASKGHVADLPKSGLGVDVDNDFAPEYVLIDRQKDTIRKLKSELQDATEVIIAVDPDREGEAIGWHVAAQLGLAKIAGTKAKRAAKGKKTLPLKRIVFTEITKNAVNEALKHPRQLDENLLNAQQARRILDRLVGYKLSPLLWKKIRYGLSAGRVQSVAVKLIVDREKERDAFNPEEYWKIFAYLVEAEKNLTKGKEPYKMIKKGEEPPVPVDHELKFELVKVNSKKLEVETEKSAQEILTTLTTSAWPISDIKTKETTRSPKPPFTTSTLQQTAANWFGYSAKKTMTLAQKLYEQGFITYMRTDSTNLSQEALQNARGYISKKFGAKYLPAEAKVYKTTVKVAQEAHEAIRPSDFAVLGSSINLDRDYQKLYELIWQRALASQMNPAKLENVTVSIIQEAGNKSFEFRINGQRILQDGYLKVYPEKVSENILPEMEVGQILYLNQLLGTQHFTQPPARFSEATLIKELEKHGIGRPSTYAPIISTIQGRKYVEKVEGYFIPTDTGIVVTKLLAKNFADIVDTDFTAGLEEDLDLVANGEKEWRKLLRDFFVPFAKKLDQKESSLSRDDFTVLGKAPEEIKCPECGSDMLIKLGKYGRFYSCDRFPDCKGMRSVDGKTNEEVEEEANSDDFKKMYKVAPKTEDGRPYLLKAGRFGKFWAHPDYPKVKDAKPLEYKKAMLKELFGETPLADDGREFVFRSGKFGKFWAHPDYPKVKQTKRIKEKQAVTS